jgi:hypothetical protein
MAVAWPENVLPSKVMFHPDIPSASGGPSFGGQEQVVFSSAGRWKASLTMSLWRTVSGLVPATRILAARAMVAYLKGRSNTVYMGVFDETYSPSALAGDGYGLITGIMHSDGTLFSDGSGYAQYATPALLAANASQGDMAAVITLLKSDQQVQAGQYFGFGASELYLINSCVADAVSGNWDVQFWPPLRSAHSAGETVNFDTPTCEMRLANDDSGQLSFGPNMSADQSLDLVEAL